MRRHRKRAPGALQQVSYLLICGLCEISVPLADRIEFVRQRDGNNVVDFVSKFFIGIARGNGNGDDNCDGLVRPHALNGSVHRCAGGEAIVYENHGFVRDVQFLLRVAILTFAAREFSLFGLNNAL
jgi:hypothetical protein